MKVTSPKSMQMRPLASPIALLMVGDEDRR